MLELYLHQPLNQRTQLPSAFHSKLAMYSYTPGLDTGRVYAQNMHMNRDCWDLLRSVQADYLTIVYGTLVERYLMECK